MRAEEYMGVDSKMMGWLHLDRARARQTEAAGARASRCPRCIDLLLSASSADRDRFASCFSLRSWAAFAACSLVTCFARSFSATSAVCTMLGMLPGYARGEHGSRRAWQLRRHGILEEDFDAGLGTRPVPHDQNEQGRPFSLTSR